jgi:hypothetical protein
MGLARSNSQRLHGHDQKGAGDAAGSKPHHHGSSLTVADAMVHNTPNKTPAKASPIKEEEEEEDEDVDVGDIL